MKAITQEETKQAKKKIGRGATTTKKEGIVREEERKEGREKEKRRAKRAKKRRHSPSTGPDDSNDEQKVMHKKNFQLWCAWLQVKVDVQEKKEGERKTKSSDTVRVCEHFPKFELRPALYPIPGMTKRSAQEYATISISTG